MAQLCVICRHVQYLFDPPKWTGCKSIEFSWMPRLTSSEWELRLKATRGEWNCRAFWGAKQDWGCFLYTRWQMVRLWNSIAPKVGQVLHSLWVVVRQLPSQRETLDTSMMCQNIRSTIGHHHSKFYSLLFLILLHVWNLFLSKYIYITPNKKVIDNIVYNCAVTF